MINQTATIYHPESIQVEREVTFSIHLIAYDQVNHTVNAIVDTSVNSSAGGLDEGQGTQHINEGCTELKFNLFSPLNSEVLMLSMRRPCNDTDISKRSISIEVKCNCPIGFEISSNDEECVRVCVIVFSNHMIKQNAISQLNQ